MPLRSLFRAAFLLLAGGLSCSAPPAKAPPDRSSGFAQPVVPYRARATAAGGLVTSVADDGRPRFIWARTQLTAGSRRTPDLAARDYFARFAPAYGIEGDALARSLSRIAVESIVRTRQGEYLVRLGQKVDGIEIYRGEVKVVMRPDLSLVALAGTPSEITGVKPAETQFAMSPGQALARALADLYGVAVPEASRSSARAIKAPYVWLDLPTGASVQLSEPARAKQIFYRAGDRLVPAYFVEFFSSQGQNSGSDAYRYLIAAADGRVLERTNLTQDAAFSYRVFADPVGEGRPFDGPIADFTPHPTGQPDGSDPAFVPPELVSMESFKAEPPGVIDPWLAGNAVQTLGNNVDAYADLVAPDGFSNGDRRATTTGPQAFDRIYDVNGEPGATTSNIDAATTNLFYIINWLHDYWYDSGFTEAAGNAQQNNFGRGGEDADRLRAEAQDVGGLNNANMSTPADGLQPRMQMYLWGAPSNSSVTVEPGALQLEAGGASFGPAEFDITADVVLVEDGTAPDPNDGCEAPTGEVAGRIALVNRGNCNFAVKAQVAEAAGAVGLIVANNAAGRPPLMGNATPPLTIHIPALSITQADGNDLKALLGQGPVSPVSTRLVRELLGPGRDGSLDTMVVAHEWGHYFHHRLTQCDTLQCGAMSEGWGDFMALHTILREGDDLDGTFGAAIYGPKAFGDSGYFGIRRFPYSVDFGKNALTFGHIQNAAVLPQVVSNVNGSPNSEVHNAGEVWTSMLFEAYIALQKNPGPRTFAEVRRAFADYLVLGLQLAPIDATYTETRDAILAAIQMIEPADLQLVAEAFARRGAGSCAIAPPRDSTTDLAPVTESFEIRSNIAVNSIAIDDSVETCDLDGTLDAGEIGRVQIEVANTGPMPLVGTTVTLSSPTAGVLFPDGPSASLSDLAPFATQSATIDIGLDDSVADIGVLDLTVTVDNPAACVASVAEVRTPRIQADEIPESATAEDVEATAPPWSKTGDGAETIWSRTELEPTNHAWQGTDSGASTDTQLVTPPLQVSPSGDFQISFEHAFSFEFSQNTFWDGGVVEISSDGGTTWQDIGDLADPGYNATITDTSGNPLGGRTGYGNTNPSYPAMDTVSLNLGAALAGQSVLVRFRIGTDDGTGAPGWTIDNLAFQGIDNTPFTLVAPHAAACQAPPLASAGPDRTVASGADVILDGSASSDPNGDPVTYLWTQAAGTGVALVNATTASAAFQAPEVSEEEVLTFQVQVSDGLASSADTVAITVVPVAPAPGGDDDGGGGGDDGSGNGGGDSGADGGGCSAGGSAGSGLPLAMLLALALVGVRRRRS